jgi:hypothetical protein
MPFDVTLPIYAVSALALVAALACAGWLLVPVPRIQVRAQNEKHGALRVIELALVLSPAGRVRQPAGGRKARATEFVVYITLKTCNP